MRSTGEMGSSGKEPRSGGDGVGTISGGVQGVSSSEAEMSEGALAASGEGTGGGGVIP